MQNTRIYSYWSVVGGAVIGGPLAAAYFLSKNFEALGRDKISGQTLWTGIGLTALAFALILLLPESLAATVGSGFSAVWIGLAIAVYKQEQEDALNDLKDQGADLASGWRAFGISLFCALPTIHLAAIIAFIIQPFAGPVPFEGQVLELEDTSNAVYYTERVTEHQAREAGTYLEAIGYFQKQGGQAVKLGRAEDGFQLVLFINPEVFGTPILEEIIEATIIDVSHRLDEPVEATVVSFDASGQEIRRTYREADFE